MSAEIENNKEEETKQPKRPLYRRLLDQWQIVFKLLELILCIICVALLYEPVRFTKLGKDRLHHVGIYYTTFTGYIIIIAVLLVGRALKDTMGFKTSFVFSISGAGMFLLTGILQIVDRAYITRNYMFQGYMYLLQMFTACCALAFLNAVAFCAEAALTFARRADF